MRKHPRLGSDLLVNCVVMNDVCVFVRSFIYLFMLVYVYIHSVRKSMSDVLTFLKLAQTPVPLTEDALSKERP